MLAQMGRQHLCKDETGRPPMKMSLKDDVHLDVKVPRVDTSGSVLTCDFLEPPLSHLANCQGIPLPVTVNAAGRSKSVQANCSWLSLVEGKIVK